MLVSDAPMGVFVSGGIDSSLVSTIAARGPARPRAVHRPTSGAATPRSRTPAAVAAASASSCTRRRLSPSELLTGWARCTWHYEAPIVTHTNAIPLRLGGRAGPLHRREGGAHRRGRRRAVPRLPPPRGRPLAGASGVRAGHRRRLRARARAAGDVFPTRPQRRGLPAPARRASSASASANVGLEAYGFLPRGPAPDHYRTTVMLPTTCYRCSTATTAWACSAASSRASRSSTRTSCASA